MPTPKKTSPAEAKKGMLENEKKWTKPVMQAGWTLLPSVLIERQQAIGIDPVDMNILLHLANRWWTAGTKPHPSVASIAKSIGRDRRTVQRRIAGMEAGGLIKREARKQANNNSQTNIYHLDGLIEALKPYAQEVVEKRETAAKAKNDIAAKKGKPKLKAAGT